MNAKSLGASGSLFPMSALVLAGLLVACGGKDAPKEDSDEDSDSSSLAPWGDKDNSGSSSKDGGGGSKSGGGDSGGGNGDSGNQGSGSEGEEPKGGDCEQAVVSGVPEPKLEIIAKGFTVPVYVLGDPQGSGDLFVVEKMGAVKILPKGASEALPQKFLEIEVYSRPSEMGLLGMDFHPNYPQDPRIFVNYNPNGKTTRVSSFKVDVAAKKADPSSEEVLLEFSQPETNHNGGMVAFGPDGMLYLTTGDGGGAHDKHGPIGNSQDRSNWHGAILRIDVSDPAGGYKVPADNPFVGEKDVLPEIWAYGLRNPWRLSWDTKNDWMYIADVGQDRYEEINIGEKGRNYGWKPMEGFHCRSGDDCGTIEKPHQINDRGYTMPIHEYRHKGEASVTGGYVYRYCEVPGWEGRYFYADYVTAQLFALEWDGAAVKNYGEIASVGSISLTSFGTTPKGEVLATAVRKLDKDGVVLRLSPVK